MARAADVAWRLDAVAHVFEQGGQLGGAGGLGELPAGLELRHPPQQPLGFELVVGAVAALDQRGPDRHAHQRHREGQQRPVLRRDGQVTARRREVLQGAALGGVGGELLGHAQNAVPVEVALHAQVQSTHQPDGGHPPRRSGTRPAELGAVGQFLDQPQQQHAEHHPGAQGDDRHIEQAVGVEQQIDADAADQTHEEFAEHREKREGPGAERFLRLGAVGHAFGGQRSQRRLHVQVVGIADLWTQALTGEQLESPLAGPLGGLAGLGIGPFAGAAGVVHELEVLLLA